MKLRKKSASPRRRLPEFRQALSPDGQSTLSLRERAGARGKKASVHH